MTLWPIEEELFIKPSRTGRKWPVSDPMALAYSGINLKKEVVVVEEKLEEKKKKILKGKHKPCKNHPDKYTVKDGLCYACYKEKYGVSPYDGKSSDKDNPEDKQNVTGHETTVVEDKTLYEGDTVAHNKDCKGLEHLPPEPEESKATKIKDEQIWLLKDDHDRMAHIYLNFGKFTKIKVDGFTAELSLDDIAFIKSVEQEIMLLTHNGWEKA